MATQSDYSFTFRTQGGEAFDVIDFELHEEISRPFTLDLRLSRKHYDPVDFKDLLDRPATLTFWQGEEPMRYVNGVITHFFQGDTGFRRTAYRATVEPAYARTALNSNCRIFQNRSAPEIIETLLNENGIRQRRFELHHSHEQRPYCVQYRETDQAFIERLAAEEGILYYFLHQDGQHILILCDESLSVEPLGELYYNPDRSASATEASLWELEYREKIATVQHRLRDYRFENPGYSLEHQLYRPVKHQRDTYTKYDYPGRYKFDAQGKPFNLYRYERERRSTELATAKSDHMQLCAGHKFKLSEAPESTHHKMWLIISARHTGAQPQSQEEEGGVSGSRYQNRLKLTPEQHPWRPASQHKPRVDGPQMAHVVGPKGEEIYTDEFARVKVQFPWDREGQYDEHAGCWIRVSQGWAGAGWGAMAIPRIGQEVIVDFLEGDPDQPIITGRTYDGRNPPPYKLPANKTRMVIKSRTHKGTGSNELRFEDMAGAEEVFIHAQRDQNNVVLNDETTEVGHDRAEHVAHDEKITIDNDRTEVVHHDEVITVDNNRTESVGVDEKITIGKNRDENVGNNESVNIGDNQTLNVGNNQSVTIGKNHTLDVGRNQKEKVGKTKTETIGLAKTLSIGAGYQITVGAAKNESVGLTSTEQVGLLKHTLVGKRYELQVGSSSVILNADGTIVIKGLKITIEGTDHVEVKSKTIKMN